MEYSYHRKNDKTRHMIKRTNCNSYSSNPMDFKLCRQVHMTEFKYYKIYQIFLGIVTIYHK